MGGSRFKTQYGPWALVTGASDGVGRAMAREAARHGLNIVLVARREERLRATAAQIEASFKTETRVIAADLGEAAGVRAVLEGVGDLEIGLLVHGAGFGTSGPFLGAASSVELEMIDVNCRAVAALTHPLAQQMADRKRGGIVLMSSIVAFQGVARSANYAATKAYVQSFAEGLRAELSPFGVDVLASAPGPVRSGFAARARMRMGAAAKPETVARGSLAALGRAGTVRPGALSKLLGYSLAMLPRFARRRIMAQIMKGMTQHQDDTARAP